MTDEQAFLAILVVLYGLECVLWVRLDAIVLRPRRRRPPRLVVPSELFGGGEKGLVPLHPLPLRGGAFVARRAELALAPLGLCAFTGRGLASARRRAAAPWTRFDAIREVRAELGALLVDGRRFVRGLSPARSQELARWIRELATLSPEARAESIEREQRAAFDLPAVRERLERHARATARLAPWCNALGAGLFLVVPGLVWWGGVMYMAPLLAIAVLPAWIGAVAAFARAHRELHPERRGERWARAAGLAAFPPALMRAQDVLGREGLEGFEPLAVALAACEPHEARAFARRVLLDARHPSPLGAPELSEEARSSVEWSRALYVDAARDALRAGGLDPDELERAPNREAGCASYCPRCERQHVPRAGECYECGIALAAFDA